MREGEDLREEKRVEKGCGKIRGEGKIEGLTLCVGGKRRLVTPTSAQVGGLNNPNQYGPLYSNPSTQLEFLTSRRSNEFL